MQMNFNGCDNFEEKKNFLRQYRFMLSKIRRLKSMLEISPENAEKYKKDIAETIKKRDFIEDRIDSVDGSLLTEILSEKYICGKSLEEIALGLSYSKRQIERLHLKALEKLVTV